MNKYTVIIQRPDSIRDDTSYDLYMAHTRAVNPIIAGVEAQLEAAKADDYEADHEDYMVMVVFEGHIHAVLWG